MESKKECFPLFSEIIYIFFKYQFSLCILYIVYIFQLIYTSKKFEF